MRARLGGFILLLLLALTGCLSQEERAAEFMTQCGLAQFSREQCAFLLALSDNQPKRGRRAGLL